MKKEFNISNYVEDYAKLIHSKNNRHTPFHRWYPFIEGFSGDFINKIIGNLEYQPSCCLDPFAGSGTTPLVCQDNELKCISFEINPFLFDLMRVKLRRDYDYRKLESIVTSMNKNLNKYRKKRSYPKVETQTLFEREGLEKWVLNKEVIWGILDIFEEIESLKNENKDLFRIALASNLLPVSNVFRNGKCLSYKPNWRKIKISRKDVHHKFINTCNVFLEDIKKINEKRIDNSKLCFTGDARGLINTLRDNSIDLVITSPPYLNSRDYTDVYRLELWMLGYIKTFKEERELRRSSLRSHVQVAWDELPILNNSSVKKVMNKIRKYKKDLWNPTIPKMINGYFCDMNDILKVLYKKLKSGSDVYIVVGNSFYKGIHIKVDEITAEIARNLSYQVIGIRVGRYTKTSGQQKSKRIRESVVVLRK
ncbi:MAG: DNA methyltransferase [Elusimicrobiota bacterium]